MHAGFHAKLKNPYNQAQASKCRKCAEDHQQLAKWLRELKERREQPEIIRCKDCKYWNNGNCNCEDIRVDCSDYYVGDLVTEEDFFCGFAKRREDG